jgi:trk/ktr system potassium uptake protein
MATYAVIGLGQLGASVATYLAERGADVIAIDLNEMRVEAIKDRVGRAMCLDATDERALRASGAGECEAVMLALGEDQLEQAVMVTMLLREQCVGRILSRAGSDIQAKVLQRLGVSRVVFPERQMGEHIARRLLAPEVEALVPLSDRTCLAEIVVPDAFDGKPIGEVHLRRDHGLNAVQLKRRTQVAADDGTVDTTWDIDDEPGPDTVLRAGDLLVVVAPDHRVQRFSRAYR